MTTPRYPAIIFKDTASFLEAFFVPQTPDDVDARKVCEHYTFGELRQEHTICGKTIPQMKFCPECGTKVDIPDKTWLCKLPFHMQVSDWQNPNYIVAENMSWDKNSKEDDVFKYSVIYINNQHFALVKHQYNKSIELIFPSLACTNDIIQTLANLEIFMDIVENDLMMAIGVTGDCLEYFSKLGKISFATETEHTINKHMDEFTKHLSTINAGN